MRTWYLYSLVWLLLLDVSSQNFPIKIPGIGSGTDGGGGGASDGLGGLLSSLLGGGSTGANIGGIEFGKDAWHIERLTGGLTGPEKKGPSCLSPKKKETDFSSFLSGLTPTGISDLLRDCEDGPLRNQVDTESGCTGPIDLPPYEDSWTRGPTALLFRAFEPTDKVNDDEFSCYPEELEYAKCLLATQRQVCRKLRKIIETRNCRRCQKKSIELLMDQGNYIINECTCKNMRRPDDHKITRSVDFCLNRRASELRTRAC